MSLQIDEDEEFGKDQVLSRDEGSMSEFFKPWRQRTSSSAEEEEQRNELIKRSHRSVMKIFFMMKVDLVLLGLKQRERASMAEEGSLTVCDTDEKKEIFVALLTNFFSN